MTPDANPSSETCQRSVLPHDVWSELAELPLGLGGQSVGVLDGCLVVAGGSYWTAPPGSGGTKRYSDRVLALRDPHGSWEEAGRLPHPVAYAAAGIVDGALLLAGGENSSGALAVTLRIELEHGRQTVTCGPRLPGPRRNAAAAVLNGAMYLCCGQSGDGHSGVSNDLWRLEGAQWLREPSLPSAPRILPSLVSCGGRLLLLGGAAFEADASRSYLQEQWTFRPARGWHRQPDLPYAMVAASSVSKDDCAYVLSGDDGSAIAASPHPGFRRTALEATVNGLRAIEAGMPLGLVTTGAALWNGMIVVAGGEDRPGSRSPRVLALRVDGGEAA